MNIGLLAVDSNYPNLALMKIAAWHKRCGDAVDWYNPFDAYDRLYMAKVFSFTPDYCYVISNCDEVVRGGTGYDIHSVLPAEIDSMQPDYSLYPTIDLKTSYGFLTRGCPNHCKWCVVPNKEGDIHPYMDIDEVTLHGARPNVVLMDNNILSCNYGVSQIEKIVARRYRIDFNQGLDARLVTPELARLLAGDAGLDTSALVATLRGKLQTANARLNRYVLPVIKVNFFCIALSWISRRATNALPIGEMRRRLFHLHSLTVI